MRAPLLSGAAGGSQRRGGAPSSSVVVAAVPSPLPNAVGRASPAQGAAEFYGEYAYRTTDSLVVVPTGEYRWQVARAIRWRSASVADTLTVLLLSRSVVGVAHMPGQGALLPRLVHPGHHRQLDGRHCRGW